MEFIKSDGFRFGLAFIPLIEGIALFALGTWVWVHSGERDYGLALLALAVGFVTIFGDQILGIYGDRENRQLKSDIQDIKRILEELKKTKEIG